MSGLWSFGSKSKKQSDQVVSSVLSALPTASVQLLSSGSLATSDASPPSILPPRQRQQHASARDENAGEESSSGSNFILAAAIMETDESVDEDWLRLRNKWMSADVVGAAGSVSPKRSAEFIAQEVQSAEKWLYSASPSTSPSPQPNAAAAAAAPASPAASAEQRSLSRGLEEEFAAAARFAPSLSPPSSVRKSWATTTAAPAAAVSPDVVDFKTLLARLDEAAAQEHVAAAIAAKAPSPPRYLSIQRGGGNGGGGGGGFGGSSSSVSYLTVVPETNAYAPGVTAPEHNSNISSSIIVMMPTRRSPKSASKSIESLSPRMARSLANTAANIDEVFGIMRQTAAAAAATAAAPAFTAAPAPAPTLAMRTTVTTRLFDAHGSESSNDGTIVNTMAQKTTIAGSEQLVHRQQEQRSAFELAAMLQRNEAARRQAGAAVRTATNLQKPSARAELHRAAVARFADPTSTEFKQQLEQDLAEIELKQKQQQQRRPPVVMSSTTKSIGEGKRATSMMSVIPTKTSRPTSASTRSASVASSSACSGTSAACSSSSVAGTAAALPARKPLMPPRHQQQQQQQQQQSQLRTSFVAPPTKSVAIAASSTTTAGFVDRMEQRTREREEARQKLLQKYDEERTARIAREIQAAEEDAQRTLAERSRAAKLRERMQDKMRAEEERKQKGAELALKQEQLAEIFWRRHFIGHVAFFPWRRMMQRKDQLAALCHHRALLRRSLSALRRNVDFARQVQRAVHVVRCVALTRLIRRRILQHSMQRLRCNVLSSRADKQAAVGQHLRFTLRRWRSRAMKRRVVSDVQRDQWAEDQCADADLFHLRKRQRAAFRKWMGKAQARQDKRARDAIRARMWSVARDVLGQP